MFLQLCREQAFNQRFDGWLPEMQEMPGVVKREAVFLIGTAEAARLRFLLQDSARQTLQMVGSAQTCQSCSNNEDHESIVLSNLHPCSVSCDSGGEPESTFTRANPTATIPKTPIVMPLKTRARS